jgi:non-specific serine/threonine protein kinase
VPANGRPLRGDLAPPLAAHPDLHDECPRPSMATRKRADRTPAHGEPASLLALAVSPRGAFHLDPRAPDAAPVPAGIAARIERAFAAGPAAGLLHLGSTELGTSLPLSLSFGRELAKLFYSRLCAVPDLAESRAAIAIPAPMDELAALAASAPPMLGGEYLSEGALAAAWSALEARAREELAAFAGPVSDYLHEKSPLWNAVGRVHFHLAENKGDERAPFAFLATYATHLSRQARVQHAPLGRAIQEYAGAANKQALLHLLQPVQRAKEKSALLKELVDSGEIFHPLAWTPRQAYAFLQDIPAFEVSGVVVRVPDWWHARRPPRPQVKVTVGARKPGGVGTDAMLDFDVKLTLDGETISSAEWRRILAGGDDLVLLKGKWVEVDRDKLQQVLDHWQRVEARAGEGVSFLEGMRMLAGVPGGPAEAEGAAAVTEWTQVKAGAWLDAVLADLQRPEGSREADPGADLKGTLRPYQRAGVSWLWLLSRLRLGGCLADDMGLGKTIQVLAWLLLLKRSGEPGPHLLVVPASLLGNWRAEIDRFAPGLRSIVLHPSALAAADLARAPELVAGADVALTTYGTVLRAPWIGEQRWGAVVLDEAQAIKNPDAKQTRAIKALSARMRLALTGTPVENRLTDLWSIFDFLCPGLLGSARGFRDAEKRLESSAAGYAPLRNLVRPYILRRLKSDKSVIADLPDKTEVRAFCSLTRAQAALYQRSVAELAAALEDEKVAGIQRRGMVLAYLLRFKQICNHPSQWLGDGAYDPAESGKLSRLRELCEPMAARQEKVLVFTQFREMTGPLAAYLGEVFGRPGLVLHGETAVAKRAGLVDEFQRDDGPPFFVLSLKAGGTGLNLTAASHVIHFDRWWNPAVENQATDRAYRIGQKKNVLVHKFVCRGTIEERIDALIEQKRGLSEEIVAGGGEQWLTELPSDELLRLVSLDLRSAVEEA